MKVESVPPRIIKGEPYAIDEGYLSNLYKFMTLMMSMPLISGVGSDMDVYIKIAFKGGPSDGLHPKITLFMDPVLR